MPQRTSIKLVDEVVRSFHVVKIFHKHEHRINSVDFSSNGCTLLSASDDDSIVLYDCETATYKKTLHSKKYGVNLIRFTHAEDTAIHCSTKVDDTIRYLSLHDNKYIRYFPGHTDKVVSLVMSPEGETFLSASLDQNVRLWDLRSPSYQGAVEVSNNPVASFNPSGSLIAVGTNSEVIKLYDIRAFDKGPLSCFRINSKKEANWTDLKFSPDGSSIVLSTDGDFIQLVDPNLGRQQHIFGGFENKESMPLEASFSPDSRFVFCGTPDGSIHVWNALNGLKTAVLPSRLGPINCVQFNPKYMMLVSATNQMAFWLPFLDDM